MLLPPVDAFAVDCAGDAVCTGSALAVAFGAGAGAGVDVVAGALVVATGAVGSGRFGCVTGFGSVFTVACGFSAQSRPVYVLGAW